MAGIPIQTELEFVSQLEVDRETDRRGFLHLTLRRPIENSCYCGQVCGFTLLLLLLWLVTGWDK